MRKRGKEGRRDVVKEFHSINKDESTTYDSIDFSNTKKFLRGRHTHGPMYGHTKRNAGRVVKAN